MLLDDPPGVLAELEQAFVNVLGASQAEVQLTSDVGAIRDSARREAVDLIVIDEAAERAHQLLQKLRRDAPDVVLVAVAAKGDVERARAAIAAGANDFLVRGPELDKRVDTVVTKLRRLLELHRKNRELLETYRTIWNKSGISLIGDATATRALLEAIRQAAKVPRPVLVVGERGTGKELVARAIHAANGTDHPFVIVNCGGVTDSLLENELFGHERGAFTGADRGQPGKFELARGGTLFLDEIGHMSAAFQRAILRVVEYGTFTRVGGTREVKAEVRIIAATNVDLKERIKREEFLPDLYDRLAFHVINVPPLRERKSDIRILAQHFLEHFMKEVPDFAGKRITDEAMQLLCDYRFPGNVRELKSIIERAVFRDQTDELTPVDLAFDRDNDSIGSGSFKERVEAYERQLIAQAYEQSGGNQAEAARALGLSYHQFRYYFQKHDVG
jgi:DNA-binding NtrC family response regulator